MIYDLNNLEKTLGFVSSGSFEEASEVLSEIGGDFWGMDLEQRDCVVDVLLERSLDKVKFHEDEKVYELMDISQRVLIALYFHLEKYQKDKIRGSFFDYTRETRAGTRAMREWLSRVDGEKEFEYLYDFQDLYDAFPSDS